MASRLEGTARFDYGGEEYSLTLNNRVLLNAETVLGYSALDAAEEAKQAMAMGRNPMLRTVVAIFYGALVAAHPELDEDTAIDMFMGEEPGPQEAFKQLLLSTNPPKTVGNGQRAVANPHRGTGKKSSASGAKRDSRRKTSG